MTARPAGPSTGLPLLGRRRSFLLSRGLQLRLGLAAAFLASVLLVPLNAALYVATASSTEAIVAEAPELAPPLEGRDRLQTRIVALGSIGFVLGVFVLGVLEGHRTAGAAFTLGRTVERVGLGQLDARVTLRRGDSLSELARRFNDMASELARRADEDERDLTRAADEIDRLADSPAAREIAGRLREIASRHRAGARIREPGLGEASGS